MDPKGGTLEIWVERSYWGHDNPLRLLFIGTIAKMLESGTLNGKTCQRTHDHTVCQRIQPDALRYDSPSLGTWRPTLLLLLYATIELQCRYGGQSVRIKFVM